jgi:riboflavin synthase alpha subunit
MYAKIKQFTPRCDQEAMFAWELELSHNLEFKGHTVKGMFESLAEVLKVIEDNKHYIVEA